MQKDKLVSVGVLLIILSQGSALIQGQDASPPLLAISRMDPESIALKWSNTPSRFVVQATDSLSEGARWQGILGIPWLDNGFFTVTQAFNGNRFFRLAALRNAAAMDYLLASQHRDGTWGDPNGSWFRDTSGIVESLASIAPNHPALAGGVSALAYRTPRNNDDLARQMVALAARGLDLGNRVEALLDSQNAETASELSPSYPGHGWGLAKGFGNSIIDTSLALRALKSAAKPAGLSLVQESLSGSSVSPAYPFMVPNGSSQPVLLVRRVTGILRFKITYPDERESVTADFSEATVPARYSLDLHPGIATLRVENRSDLPASVTAELGFTTPGGWNTFRVTTPLTFLGLAQSADGGWGIQPGRDSHFMITAEVLRCLAIWKTAFAGQQVIPSAVAWLGTRRNPDGGFSSEPGASTVYETSLATLALLAADSTGALAGTAGFLVNAQLPDGSWASSAYQTALALQALRVPLVASPIPGQTVVGPGPLAPVTP